MKKVFSLALLLSCALYAETKVEKEVTRSVEEIKRDAQILRYTITLFKDSENFDVERWKQIIDDAVASIETVSSDELKTRDAYIETMLRSLNTVYKNGLNSQGIHGTISISLNDGKCPQGCCNEPCECKEEYRGLCPCSLDTSKSCKKSTSCECATKSEGCKCPADACCKKENKGCCK